jgi:poly(beta-D-mannuronate) lyase
VIHGSFGFNGFFEQSEKNIILNKAKSFSHRAFTLAMVLGASLLCAVVDVHAEVPLRSAFDVQAARATWAHVLKNDKDPFECKKPVQAVVTFEGESRYCDNDKTRSIVCPEKEKKYKAATKDVNAFNLNIVEMANRYAEAKKPRPEIAQCVLSHLDAWAKAGAWAPKEAQSMTGELKRGESVAAMAAALQQVMGEPSLDREALARVSAWLRDLGYRLHEYTQAAQAKGSNAGIGNHRYWQGLGIVQAAIVAQDRELYAYGMKALDIGLAQVQPSGVLPIEMSRAKRAFNYHLFAIAPLVMLEEIKRVNAEVLDDASRVKLEAVVSLVTDEMLQEGHESAVFPYKDHYEDLKPNQLAFLELYLKRRSNPQENARAFEQARIVKYMRNESDGMIHATMLGGEVTFWFGSPQLLHAK